MAITVRSLNALLNQKGLGDTKEATHYKGEYWLLHICKNGVPVPLNHDNTIGGIEQAINLLESE